MRIASPILAGGLAALALLAAPARATPISYSTGLANPALVLDFSGLAVPEGGVVGNAYAAQGVTFAGLYVYSGLADTLPPSTAPAAANFSGSTTNSTFSIAFSSAVTDVAFFLYTDGGGTTITSSRSGTTVETVTAGTFDNTGRDFFGFTGSSFDLITISVAGSGNALIDNVEIGTAGVPEPATAALLLMGLTGAAAVRRRRA